MESPAIRTETQQGGYITAEYQWLQSWFESQLLFQQKLDRFKSPTVTQTLGLLFFSEQHMSKKIFELRKFNPSGIIDRTKESFMTVDHDYVKHLEQLVLKLIPVYDRYYKLTGDKKPPLENLAIEKVIKKTPALLRAW